MLAALDRMSRSTPRESPRSYGAVSATFRATKPSSAPTSTTTTCTTSTTSTTTTTELATPPSNSTLWRRTAHARVSPLRPHTSAPQASRPPTPAPSPAPSLRDPSVRPNSAPLTAPPSEAPSNHAISSNPLPVTKPANLALAKAAEKHARCRLNQVRKETN